MARKVQQTSTRRQLQNKAFDLLSANYKRSDKFYTEDCDDLWRHLSSRTDDQLRETIARWTAINNISEADMRRHCQFDG